MRNVDVKKVLHGIVQQIDNDLYKDENKKVVHKTNEFKDLYYRAHGDFMPDDHIYEHIEKIISEIEMYLRYNTDDYDVIDDLIDELAGEIYIEPDQNTGALLDWVSSNLNRYAIVDKLHQEDFYKHSSLLELMQLAQSIESEGVKMSILNDLKSMVEEIE